METATIFVLHNLLLAFFYSCGVLSNTRPNQSHSEIYKSFLDDSTSYYPIQIQTPARGICSQECFEIDCFRFSYDPQTEECLLDTCLGEGQYNRSSDNQVYRSLLHPITPVLSRGKAVTHSTVYISDYDYSGLKVVDGYYLPAQSGLSVFASLFILVTQQDPWFEIDLEYDFCIEGMKFWRRADRVARDLALTVAKDDQHGIYTLCAFRNGFLDLVENVECISPVTGRYMKVVQQTSHIYFQLHEVEVYGH